MLSNEEIEAFLDDDEEYETVHTARRQTAQSTYPRGMPNGMQLMAAATKTQFAMFRAWQNAFKLGR